MVVLSRRRSKLAFIFITLNTVIGLGFSFWYLPHKLINPRYVSWVFVRSTHLLDGSGHAIQAMYFGEEPWRWPIGRFQFLGGPTGASLIMAAVSPVLALPAKLLESIGVIGHFWQFIGIQSLIGITGTSLAVYFLCIAVGASSISSSAVSAMALCLPNLLAVALFNESLSWQFMPLLPMIVMISKDYSPNRFWPWLVFGSLAVVSNTYYLPMISMFFLVHLVVGRVQRQLPLWSSVQQLIIYVSIVILIHYLGGGFTISPGNFEESSPGSFEASITLLKSQSVDLASFFDRIYDRQAYVYRGSAVMITIAAGLLIFILRWWLGADARSFRSKVRSWTTLPRLGAIVVALILFFISLGPTIQIGSEAFKLPLPIGAISIMGLFRGIGRFSFPFVYLLLAAAALAIDIIGTLWSDNRRRCVPVIFSLSVLLVACQFIEFHSEMVRLQSAAVLDANQVFAENASIDHAVSKSSEIRFVPAYDDPSSAPFQPMSYYGIKYRVPIYTYHWLGRFDVPKLLAIRNETIRAANHCEWFPGVVYVVKNRFVSIAEQCNVGLEVVSVLGEWTVLQIHGS